MEKLRESIFFKTNDLAKYEEKYNREINYIHSLTLHRNNEIIRQLNELFVDLCTDKVYLTSKYKKSK